MITMIAGFRVVRDSDNAYTVHDSVRVLGGVVRFWVQGDSGAMCRKFRAFGCDFDTLSAAVSEFAKISGVSPLDAKGDLPE